MLAKAGPFSVEDGNFVGLNTSLSHVRSTVTVCTFFSNQRPKGNSLDPPGPYPLCPCEGTGDIHTSMTAQYFLLRM